MNNQFGSSQGALPLFSVSKHFHEDVAWSLAFAMQCKGVILLQNDEEAPPVCLATDASGEESES